MWNTIVSGNFEITGVITAYANYLHIRGAIQEMNMWNIRLYFAV